MKLKQITIATGLALVAGQAFALSPTSPLAFTLNSSGSSAQQASLGGVFTSLCQAGTIDTFYDTATSGSNHRAYSCTLKTTLGDPLLNGKNMLFIHRAQGGSINGVNPVAKAENLARMVVDGTCVATGNVYPVLPQYKCANTVNAIPDAGVSDEEPALFKGINLPAGATALTNGQLGNLSSFSQNAVVFGIATTNNVNAAQPNLSRAQVTTLATGLYGDWGNVNGALAGKPVVVCRRAPGSGSQAAMNAYFPGFPCSTGAVSPADASYNSVFDGSAFTVIENSSTGAVANCLNAAFNGGAFTDAYGTVFTLPAGSAAVGILSTEKQPVATDKWKFSNLDGTPATVLNATTGTYDFFVEQSFQYRNKDVCQSVANPGHATPCLGGETLVVKPTPTQVAFMTKFIAASGDPVTLSTIPGVAALPSLYDPTLYPAGQVMKGTRANNTCSPTQMYY